MKRIASGYYRETRTINGYAWEVEIVRVEGEPYWYWDASCEEKHKYNQGGQDWHRTKAAAMTDLERAVSGGMI